VKVSYIQPFVDGATEILQNNVFIEFTRGPLGVRHEPHTTQDVTILLGVGGENVTGLVMYSMSRETAMAIAEKMAGMPFEEFGDLAQSAVSELGNQITGHAITMLSESGYSAMITPPALILGSDCKISTLDMRRLVVPMHNDEIGSVEIQVGLEER
jgi:chemotaxis protein CheX